MLTLHNPKTDLNQMLPLHTLVHNEVRKISLRSSISNSVHKQASTYLSDFFRFTLEPTFPSFPSFFWPTGPSICQPAGERGGLDGGGDGAAPPSALQLSTV